jgi:hypothetical protein
MARVPLQGEAFDSSATLSLEDAQFAPGAVGEAMQMTDLARDV